MNFIPVNSFEDADTVIVQGLKQRFSADTKFPGVRVATVKKNDDSKFEVIVSLRGGQEINGGTMREIGVSLLVFADTDMNASSLAEVTVEYLKSLVAFGKIKSVEINNYGLHIENTGPQFLRQVTALVRTRAIKTTLY